MVGRFTALYLIAFLLASVTSAFADIAKVLRHQKISSLQGGFLDTLDEGDVFGVAVAPLGDFDNDGVEDIVVGAYGDDDGGVDRGAVWILLLNTDGSVKSPQKISMTQGRFGGDVKDSDSFGTSIAVLGDLDGDGVTEIAVGSLASDAGGVNRGAIWILFLNGDATIKRDQKISSVDGGFSGALDDVDRFGNALAPLGDLDGDGVPDLAAGAVADDDGGLDRGAVWILFLNRDGTVKNEQKISNTIGGFTGVLENSDFFGTSIGTIGDLDKDGVTDLVIGAIGDDDGGIEVGAAWIIFLNADGTVKAQQKISTEEGNFSGDLDQVDRFGGSATGLGDLDGDGTLDVGVGAWRDDDGGFNRGAVWFLYLNSDGTVKRHLKISDTQGNFSGTLRGQDVFGNSLTLIGDLNDDGAPDFAVGAPGADDGGQKINSDRGAVWLLFLRNDNVVKFATKISGTAGNFAGRLDNGDVFGWSVAPVGDFDGDGVPDVVAGARLDDDGGTNRGAIWLLLLNQDGTVKHEQKISDELGGFEGTLRDVDAFGWSVASIGLFDGDKVPDLAVGAPWDDDGGANTGALWILFLRPDGTVKRHQKISTFDGGLEGALDNQGNFGGAVAFLGDMDGDGIDDLAVGSSRSDDGGVDRGAVWILFMNADGTVKSHQKISGVSGGFTGELDNQDEFGWSVASLGDLDLDGTTDIAVGAYNDDDGGTNKGAAWILFLNSDGTVKTHQKISATDGAFRGNLSLADNFCRSIAPIGDFDGDGIIDIAVGAAFDDDGATASGAIWLLLLNRDGTVKSHQKFSDSRGNFGGNLAAADWFGSSVACVGDMDDNGVVDLIVGATGDDDGGFASDHGALWTLFLDTAPVTVENEVARWSGTHVEITWSLSLNIKGLSFDVSRKTDGDYASLSDPEITQQAEAFVLIDRTALPENNYSYQVMIHKGPDVVTSFEVNVSTPSAVLLLHQNFPNPFNPGTTILFDLDQAADVSLAVYDVSGRRVRTLLNRPMTAGNHRREWDGRDEKGHEVASGIYFYRLQSGDRTLTRKAMLLR